VLLGLLFELLLDFEFAAAGEADELRCLDRPAPPPGTFRFAPARGALGAAAFLGVVVGLGAAFFGGVFGTAAAGAFFFGVVCGEGVLVVYILTPLAPGCAALWRTGALARTGTFAFGLGPTGLGVVALRSPYAIHRLITSSTARIPSRDASTSNHSWCIFPQASQFFLGFAPGVAESSRWIKRSMRLQLGTWRATMWLSPGEEAEVWG